jgi:hypothetical protein
MSDTSFGSALGNISPLQAGALGAGALGVGSLLAQGPGNLPWEFGAVASTSPWLTSTGQQTIGQGQQFINQGEQTLNNAAAGDLTGPQQAQLGQYSAGLNNQSRQMFYNMGRNPDADTAAITQQGNVDQQVNAMAQQMIQSTIQLGLGQISEGNSLMSTGSGEISAANNALIAAGNAQVQQDTAYSTNLTNAFSAIGKMFGVSALAGGGSSAGSSSSGVLADLGLAGEDPATVLASLALV